MRKNWALLFFSFVIIYSCTFNEDSINENSSIIQSDIQSIDTIEYKIDSLSIVYNNKAAELWPQLYPNRIPLAMAYLDTALSLDSTNIPAHSHKLILLQLTDSVKSRDYFFKIERLYPEFNVSPFFLGIMNDYYGYPDKARKYYLEVLEYYKNVNQDSLNNTEDIQFLDGLAEVYVMLEEEEKIDSVLQIIESEFPLEFKQWSIFYNEESFRTKKGILDNFTNGFYEYEDYDYSKEVFIDTSDTVIIDIQPREN
ncbi:MAG: hypothetical protein JJ971_14870 [Balneolaceae bacterium]|nr:hypothetical protein [Balneolaceae bacterium]MBO6547681.1 hypothetical protein [Balneolaceae bacterium]MBO6648192.1 hypothetical protein [Balneolaceae bacterium]